MNKSIYLLTLASVFPLHAVIGADWPQWRGPERSGSFRGEGLVAELAGLRAPSFFGREAPLARAFPVWRLQRAASTRWGTKTARVTFFASISRMVLFCGLEGREARWKLFRHPLHPDGGWQPGLCPRSSLVTWCARSHLRAESVGARIWPRTLAEVPVVGATASPFSSTART